MPIPCKLVGIYNALVTNFSWICPKNLFNENSVPKHDYKGYSKPQLDSIHFFIPIVDPDPPLLLLDSQCSAPSSKALKKSTLGR
jgi:hypothetical protein